MQPKDTPVSLSCSSPRQAGVSGKAGGSAILSCGITLTLTGPEGHFGKVSLSPSPVLFMHLPSFCRETAEVNSEPQKQTSEVCAQKTLGLGKNPGE